MKHLSKAEKSLAEKYSGKLGEALGESSGKISREASKNSGSRLRATVSSNYKQFKKENLPRHLTFYEKLCNKSERLIKIKPSKKKTAEIQSSIKLCHLSSTPAGAMSLAVIVGLLTAVLGGLFGFFLIKSLLVVVYAVGMGLFGFVILLKTPEILANNFRLAASNQMVQCIFYVATFMRHTSNLELAIKFAADRLSPPMSIDLKKIIWDVETGKHETIKESLDIYLETWRKWNLEFIESFHMIEGSLYESSEERNL
jgi:hypothetical protein